MKDMNHTLLRSFSRTTLLLAMFASTIRPHKHTDDTPTPPILEKLVLLVNALKIVKESNFCKLN